MAAPPEHWLPAFMHFISKIRITSKELEKPTAIIPYDAQTRFLEAMASGLQEDIHHFVCLKARQLGISTILLALDIFWLQMFPGLQGALIADTGDNKETFRETITEMLDSLPAGYKVKVRRHNRNALILANGSRLQYMSAGKAGNTGLGRSRALNFVHATECSSWKDQVGLDSVRAALALENPNRLYIFESTALGFNLFYDIYEEAKDSGIQKAFFIGWWAKEIYRIRENTSEFDRWWNINPELTEEEDALTLEVLEEYGHQITPEQWAWFRRESFNKSQSSLHSEFPTTERLAWQSTGFPFFSMNRVNQDQVFIRNQRVTFNGYRYELGEKFLAMKCSPTTTLDDIELRVWEDPKPDGVYVMGVDPAYGRDEWKDRSVISVWRCYSDKIVQVAEYATPWPETRHVAWVMAHLAGCYRNVIINLEITGPGGSVMQELNYLRQQMQYGKLKEIAADLNPEWALDQARWFLYHRVDSMGPGYMYNWKTSVENKLLMLNRFRDSYNTEELIVRSLQLLDEMITLVQEGSSIHAAGRGKDDRVMGAALAHYAWAEWQRTSMMANGETFDKVQSREAEVMKAGRPVIDWIVPRHMAAAEAEARRQELKRLLEE
jgi:hypothetical protein